MGDINVQLVREFFELNLFHALTQWQQMGRRTRPGEQSGQLFVCNTNPSPSRELPFLLQPFDVGVLERAVVEVRAWHGERFYPSLIESNPVLYQFASPEALAYAEDIFQHHPFTTVLVVSELPATPELRARSLALLEDSGIGHVLEFSAILRDLVDRVDVCGNYALSDTLQLLRLMKRYKLVRNQQMEFTFSTEPPPSERPPIVEASPLPAED